MWYGETQRKVTNENMEKISRTLLAIFVVCCVLGVWFLGKSGFFQAMSSQETMQAYIQQWTPYSHLVFFLIHLCSVVMAPIPSNVTAMAGGVLFGGWMSFSLTYLAVVMGSMLVFWLGRQLGQRRISNWIGKTHMETYMAYVEKKAGVFLLLAFLLPFFPDDILCILAGLTAISYRRFFVLVLLARPWGLLFAAFFGDSVIRMPVWCIALFGLLGMIIFLVILCYGEQIEKWLLHYIGKL